MFDSLAGYDPVLSCLCRIQHKVKRSPRAKFPVAMLIIVQAGTVEFPKSQRSGLITSNGRLHRRPSRLRPSSSMIRVIRMRRQVRRKRPRARLGIRAALWTCETFVDLPCKINGVRDVSGYGRVAGNDYPACVQAETEIFMRTRASLLSVTGTSNLELLDKKVRSSLCAAWVLEHLDSVWFTGDESQTGPNSAAALSRHRGP